MFRAGRCGALRIRGACSTSGSPNSGSRSTAPLQRPRLATDLSEHLSRRALPRRYAMDRLPESLSSLRRRRALRIVIARASRLTIRDGARALSVVQPQRSLVPKDRSAAQRLGSALVIDVRRDRSPGADVEAELRTGLSEPPGALRAAKTTAEARRIAGPLAPASGPLPTFALR